MKKLFNEINFTWKKIIFFAIIVAIYTAIMAVIPITKDTSFRDIAINFEWWILFGVLIISNSKTPRESALKCFVFFLISQPLIYLFQVPFSSKGFELFSYYGYWFLWTICTLPMGYIGYYIKKNNLLSVIILLPILMLLSIHGVIYFFDMINKFPQHLLSCIFCFAVILIITFNIFNKFKWRMVSLIVTIILTIFYIILNLQDSKNIQYDVLKNLEEYNIKLTKESTVLYFFGNAEGEANIVSDENQDYILRLKGETNGKYNIAIVDSEGIEHSFEYQFTEKNGLVFNKTN